MMMKRFLIILARIVSCMGRYWGKMNIKEALETILNDTNKKGSELDIASEQQVYDIIDD